MQCARFSHLWNDARIFDSRIILSHIIQEFMILALFIYEVGRESYFYYYSYSYKDLIAISEGEKRKRQVAALSRATFRRHGFANLIRVTLY